MEEALKAILELNNSDCVHCNLSMANVVVDYPRRIRVRNFDHYQSQDECWARLGRGHYKDSAPKSLVMPRKSIYDKAKYEANVDCFAVGVMAWKLATGSNAFDDLAQDSNSPAADMNGVYYNRKISKLSESWVQFSQGDPAGDTMKHITKIMDI
jgi:hypothetical protein